MGPAGRSFLTPMQQASLTSGRFRAEEAFKSNSHSNSGSLGNRTRRFFTWPSSLFFYARQLRQRILDAAVHQSGRSRGQLPDDRAAGNGPEHYRALRDGTGIEKLFSPEGECHWHAALRTHFSNLGVLLCWNGHKSADLHSPLVDRNLRIVRQLHRPVLVRPPGRFLTGRNRGRQSR